MVRMDKLLEAWRSDPRVEPTVELCSMFARASQKPAARDAIPRPLLIGFANDALGRHLGNLDVLEAVCDMYLSAGEVELAADVADRALRAHPDEDRTRVIVARVNLLRGKQTRELVSGEESSDDGGAREEHTGGSEGVTLDAPTAQIDEGMDPPTEPQTRKNESIVALLGEKARGRTPLATPDPPQASGGLLRNPTQVGMGLAPPPPMQRKRTLQGGIGDGDRGLLLKPPGAEAEKRDEDDVPTRTETQVSSQRQASEAPPPPPSRKETRRAAVREKRGVGADDPLMKAAVARRNQLANDGEGQKTRPDRDNQPTRDFSPTALPPLEDDDGTAPTRARPVLPPPARPSGAAAAYAPTLLGTSTLEPEEASTDVQDPITGMVTNVWDRSRGAPQGAAPTQAAPTQAAPAQAPPRPGPQAQMTKLEPDEDAIETNLRTLPDHLRQMARNAAGQPDPEEAIETNLREVPPRVREVARRSIAEPDDDDGQVPRTYIMKPEERAAAAHVDPRPPTASSMPPATHVIPGEPPLRMKPAALPSFGPPPPRGQEGVDPLAVSGQGPIASIPPSSGDPGVSQRSLTYMTPSFTPAPLAISSPPGAPNPYETGARPYDPARPPDGPRRSTGLYIALGMAIVMVGILVSYAGYLVISDYGKPKTADAGDRAAQAEERVLAGSPRDLTDATVLLSGGERTLSKAEVLVLVRAEMLEALDVTGKEGGLRQAIALESQLRGAPSPAAELVLAMVDGSASDVERALERARAVPDDPYAALVEGALLEKRGSLEAASKYEKALALAPKLTSARVRLAHLLLLDGKIKEAEAQIRFLDEKAPARAVLSALVWASSKVYGGEARTRPERLPTSAEVPRVLHGVYAALSVLDAGAGSDPSGLCARAIAESEVPGVALFFGRLALTRNDRVTAIRAARRALDLSPGLRSAIDLAGKSALELGKLAEIDDIVKKGPPDVTRHLAALAAYEAFDVDGLRDLAAITTGDEADKLVIKAQLTRLKGKPLVETEMQQLAESKVTGADLVLVDLLLDAGTIDRAGKIIDAWGDTTSAASRARRAARLLRYRGDLDEAGLALANADPGQATFIERVLLDAEIPRQRDRAIEALLRRPSPLEGTQVRKYLEAYVRARTDETARAEDLIKEIDPPTSTANFPSRVCAALAFAENKDKRGEALVRSLFEVYPMNRDVLRAAAGFGLAELPTDSH